MKRLLIGTVLTAFITTYVGGGLTIAIPSIESDLNMGSGAGSWLVTVYMATSTVFCLIFGVLAERGNKVRFLTVGIMLFTAASAAAGFINEWWMLLAFRFLQGLGAAMVFPVNMAIAASAAGPDRRGVAVGVISGANYAGMAAGPAAGGFIIDIIGWRGFFFTSGLIGLAALLLVGTNDLKKKRSMDPGQGDGYEFILEDKRILLLIFAFGISYGTAYMVTYMLTNYLGDVMGYSAKASGLILVAGPAVQALSAPFLGHVSDNKGKLLMISGAALTCVSAGAASALVYFAHVKSIFLIVAVQTGIGLGTASIAVASTLSVLKPSGKERYSLASAGLASARSAGHAFSTLTIWLTSFLFAIEDAPYAYIGLNLAIWTLAAGFAGVLMAISSRNRME